MNFIYILLFISGVLIQLISCNTKTISLSESDLNKAVFNSIEDINEDVYMDDGILKIKTQDEIENSLRKRKQYEYPRNEYNCTTLVVYNDLPLTIYADTQENLPDCFEISYKCKNKELWLYNNFHNIYMNITEGRFYKELNVTEIMEKLCYVDELPALSSFEQKKYGTNLLTVSIFAIFIIITKYFF